MNLVEAIKLCPHLASPAALANADTQGKWKMAPHLAVINRELMNVGFGRSDRVGVHLPFQHGKSWLCSHYFPAWLLLLFPHMRIALASYEEHYSGTFGRKVRDVIQRFGGPHGVVLRADTKAKNEWTIQGHDGGMVCKGVHGALTGRAADCLILDDVLKNAEQAQSQTMLEAQWDWYSTVAYSRLGPKAPIVMVTTRWCKGDLPGRIYADAKLTGEKWKVLKFKAIADDHDPLGRKRGEALWPARVPLNRLERIRQTKGRWFNACWQQEPDDEQGLLFRPRPIAPSYAGWPKFVKLGDAFSIELGTRRHVFHISECTIIVAVDWAMYRKKDSDFTCMGAAALTPCGKLLILDCINERIRHADNASRLAEFCRTWRPHIVVGDDDFLAEGMVLDCRRYKDIPEIKRLKIGGKNKVIRCTPSIIRGDNGLVYLPDRDEVWTNDFCDQLVSFTGQDDEHDDVADMVGILGRLADELKGDGREEQMPDVLTPARNLYGEW